MATRKDVNRSEGSGQSIFRERPKTAALQFNVAEIEQYAVPIAAMIRATIEYGDCLSFALTGDGSQLVLTRIHNATALKGYVPKDAELGAALRQVAADVGVDYAQVVDRAALTARSVQETYL